MLFNCLNLFILDSIQYGLQNEIMVKTPTKKIPNELMQEIVFIFP
jgi:hypothetical protein